jgi:hypothetical protein
MTFTYAELDALVKDLQNCSADFPKEAADAITYLRAQLAERDGTIDQLEQDLSDMRDNAESAYRRGYYAGRNGG